MDSFQNSFHKGGTYHLNQYAVVTEVMLEQSACQIMNILASSILEFLEFIMITLRRY